MIRTPTGAYSCCIVKISTCSCLIHTWHGIIQFDTLIYCYMLKIYKILQYYHYFLWFDGSVIGLPHLPCQLLGCHTTGRCGSNIKRVHDTLNRLYSHWVPIKWIEFVLFSVICLDVRSWSIALMYGYRSTWVMANYCIRHLHFINQ